MVAPEDEVAPMSARSPERRALRRRDRLLTGLAVLAVLLAGFCGGLVLVSSYTAERQLSAGTISLSVAPFHPGALDLYVPLIDWGVRFDAVRFPARLQVELRTADRRAVARVARDGLPAAGTVRAQARDGIASYLRKLAALAAAAALVLALLVVAALRPDRSRARVLVATAVVGAAAWAAAVAFLLAPRGPLSSPVYYAHGEDIPVALRAVEAASRAPGRLSDAIDNQLLGLARLVTAPGNRVPLTGLPRVVLASDIHNNLVVIPSLRRAAAGGPLVIAGDLSDRGTPLETSSLRSIAHAGNPVVFVAGNHDSDTSSRSLARAGVIVLTRHGRLLPDGRHGTLVVRVAGLRMAGYESPNIRLLSQGYRDRGAEIDPVDQAAFSAWLAPLLGRVDVVVVHEPALAASALQAVRDTGARRPLVALSGHTHHQAVRSERGVVEINGGTAGAGGTGNLDERQPIGLAIITYRPDPFKPLAVDLVQVAPGTGAGSARRLRLDGGPVGEGDVLAPSPEQTDGDQQRAG